MIHNENSRVKIPALVHLTRLKYDYLSLKLYSGEVCPETNIFKSLFWDGINRINGCKMSEQDVDRLLDELTIKLSNDDLGRAFYLSVFSAGDTITPIVRNLRSGLGPLFFTALIIW